MLVLHSFVVLSIVSFSVSGLLLRLYCTGDFSPQTYRILPHSDSFVGVVSMLEPGIQVQVQWTYSSGRAVARGHQP